MKEIHFLPEETIEARFNIKDDEGVVIEMMGKITDGMMGTGFLYTNKESITIGVGCMLIGLQGEREPQRALRAAGDASSAIRRSRR